MAEVLREAKPPKPKMSFKQCSAVCALRNDSNIVIVSADKGKATVVMDRGNYNIKMKAILQDGQYKPLQRDPTIRMEKEIADTLKRLHDNKLCDFLTSQYSTPHRCTAYLRSTKRVSPCDVLCQPSTLHPTNLPKNWPILSHQ